LSNIIATQFIEDNNGIYFSGGAIHVNFITGADHKLIARSK